MEAFERFMGKLLSNKKGASSDLFTRKYLNNKPASITVDGPPQADFLPEGPFPKLSYGVPAGTESIIITSQDADTPAGVITHSFWFNVPPTTTSVSSADVTKKEADFPWGLGKSLLGSTGAVYYPARGLMGHGPHNFHYQVICLSKKITAPKGKKVSEADIVQQISGEGDVIAWGEWVGLCERVGKNGK